MKISQIAATLGLDEVEAIRPIPLTDDLVGPVPPRPKDRGSAPAGAPRIRNRQRQRSGV